jgi:hypothetical protein
MNTIHEGQQIVNANFKHVEAPSFTRADLANFGRYLLSDIRTKRVMNAYTIGDGVSLAERLKEVYDADVENFLGLPQTA